MNREQYIKELRSKLINFSSDEKDEAILYYEEYFDEAGDEHEQDIIKELGPVSQLASQINAEAIIKRNADEKQKFSHKIDFKNIWVIIIGIFALPIALPLALALVILALTLIIVVFTVFVAIFATGAAAAVVAIPLIIVGICTLGNPANGLICLGAGLLIIGIGIAIIPAISKVIAIFSIWLFNVLSKLYYRLKGEVAHEKTNESA